MAPVRIKAKHCVVTANCRVVNGGDLEALEVAFEQIREEYKLCLAGQRRRGVEPDMHVELHVELHVEQPGVFDE